MHIKNWGFSSVLEKDEHVVKVFQRRFFPVFLILFLTAAFFGGLVWLAWFLFAERALWGIVGLCVLGVARFGYVFAKWYLNAIVMTTENIIIFEWFKPFHKNTIILNYWNLDEPQIRQNGVFSFLQNEGDITFLKVNIGKVYTYERIHRPHKVLREIHEYKEEQLHQKNFKEESALKDLISQMVQTHAREHGAPEKGSVYYDPEEDRETPPKKGKPIDLAVEALEFEKQLDDFGGIEIDLSDDDREDP